MHVSRQYLQQLEKSTRQVLRMSAVDEAKKASSNKTRKIPAVNYVRQDRHGKGYELGS